ncbi:hypothetical protein PIB30_108183 [Stylosanthes scabra]|uniref:Uncharacterized protein n=1 Tax=Stylosanthes scabra TaxID=79078 RepID=A0ABU6XZH7_9FABA|nr:hypothetical protein [Stylosanthes scabra]
MSRSKKPTSKRQRQSDDILYIEPSTEHQFARYFSRLDDLNHYVFNFHDRKEISPRLFKNEYEVNSGTLSTLWGFDDLDTSNCVLFDGNKTPESWGPHVKKQAFEMFNIQRAPRKKILCNVFNFEMRLLHYLITYVIFPRSTGHAHVQVDDLVIIWAMNNDIKIHWPYFIAHHMLRFTKDDHGKGIGYVFLWTMIFKHLGIDISNENHRKLAQQHVIDIRALHHMSSNVQREEEVQEPPPQAQEDQVGPSEQPSMSDLMKVLQSIEQNMNQRFKGIEDNQARMESNQQHLDQQIQSLQQEQRKIWRSIRRVEAWTFSEDEEQD